MVYCINPKCHSRLNADNLERCQACGTELLINERYRLIIPLRDLDKSPRIEVFQVDSCGTPKVMKVLKDNHSKLVELFKREVQALRQINHPGIPKVDVSFVFSPCNSCKELHCIVMEKIAGENLAQWLEQNQPISQAQAIIWLEQLADILAKVHQHNLFHRDIKPSNIMLKPDGKLVLIDFGTVRELTTTYIEKLEDYDVTRVYSQGYTAPEQIDGLAVPASDFFSLGRTFVHLLTGKHPCQFENPTTGEIIWQDRVPGLEKWFVNLIDDLMAPSPQNRPSNPQGILSRLKNYQNTTTLPPGSEKSGNTTNGDADASRWARWIYSRLPTRRALGTVIFASAIATAAVMGVRSHPQLHPRSHLMLQTWELQAYDQLMRSRPDEGPDPRILVIGITDEDLQIPEQKDRKGSLSDLALAQLLEKLESYKPRVIGLDIFRDFPVDSKQASLKTRLQSVSVAPEEEARLFAICHVGEPGNKDRGIAPPPDVPTERQGFSNVIPDPADRILRRHLLSMDVPPTSVCTTSLSLSLQLALRYLKDEGMTAKMTQGNWQLGSVVFKRLQSPIGGYQKADTWGNQVLLNYRSYRSPKEIADTVTLTDVLRNKVKPEMVQNRIVLIGVMTRTSSDYFSTPYSSGLSPYQEIPGVIVQAQMVSQILSAVLDGRPLLWVWSFWGEFWWVWGWSVVGGVVAWHFRSIGILELAAFGIALGVLYGLCFWLLTQGGWMPLVPSALALVITGGSVLAFSCFTAQS